MQRVLIVLSLMMLSACTGMPDRVRPVQGFDAERYLGQWYEIARLDHSFERGLSRVTATYTRRDDGGIRVVNRGYSAADDEWREAEGKAYFVGPPSEGYLKVSFFGPFYGAYVVFHLDQVDYQYAFVSGPDTGYLWLLARTPTVSEALKAQFAAMAAARDFDTAQLIWVEQ